MKGNIAIVSLIIGSLALLAVSAQPILQLGSGGQTIPTASNSGSSDFTVGGALTVSGTATSTFNGGLDVLTIGGIETQSGLTITGGALLGTNIGATLGSTSVTGITSSGGITISAGCLSVGGTCISGTIGGSGAATRVAFFDGANSLSSNSTFTFTTGTDLLTLTSASTTNLSVLNVLDIDGTGTSTFDGGALFSRIRTSTASSSVSIASTTPSNIAALEVSGNIFIGRGQVFSEWFPLTMTAGNTWVDCAEGSNFRGTLSIAITIVRAKNCQSGQGGIIQLTQDTTGGRVIGWGSTSPSQTFINPQFASSTANAVNWFYFKVQGSNVFLLAATATTPTCGIGC